jgi:hypothetical protein
MLRFRDLLAKFFDLNSVSHHTSKSTMYVSRVMALSIDTP